MMHKKSEIIVKDKKIWFVVISSMFAIIYLSPTESSVVLANSTETFIAKDISVYLLLCSMLILLPMISFLLSSRNKLQEKTSELYAANSALHESEERYALAAAGANDGIWDWDLRKGEVYFSNRWKKMLGYNDKVIGNTMNEWFERVHPEDIETFNKDISEHINGLTIHLENEHRMLHKNGNYIWVLSRGIATKDQNGHAVRIAGSLTDITDQKNAEEQLIRHALYDMLTGLPNRILFMDRLERAFTYRKRHEQYLFAVLFLDLDRFKNINDSFGHIIGDELLQQVTQRLQNSLRTGDTISRFGGDEFTILIEDINNVNEAKIIADRINKDLTLPFYLKGQEVFINTSIGIAFSGAHYENPDEILRDADTALYKAKAGGKACCIVFDKVMHMHAMERFQIERDLSIAIRRQEFVLHYQPIISLQKGCIKGFESLIRWNHPEKGLLFPMEFIPLAEETGQILPLGIWILRESCLQTVKWQKMFPMETPLTISVNTSCKQLTQPNFIENLKDILDETGIDPRCLILELTESNIMENTEIALNIFNQLNALHVQVHIDDFGTGYSSLSYLHRFPISALKIDRSFVFELGKDGERSDIVRSIIDLAYHLKINVIAEGVERADHLSALKKLNCEFAQGYFFSRPVNKEKAENFLESWRVVDKDGKTPMEVELCMTQ